MRKDSERAIATDAEGHVLRIRDNVKEVDGEVRNPSSVLNFLCSTDNFCVVNREERDKFSIFISPSMLSYSTEITLRLVVLS